MVAEFKIFFFHSQWQKEVFAIFLPIAEPFQIRSGLAEKFKFHLFEFAHAENKVSGGDFVTERFTYLAYTERNAHTRGTLNVFEVYEYALCGFGAEINGVYAVFGNALKSFEHKVELSYRRKIAFAANGACDFFVAYKAFEFVVIHTFDF